MRKLASKLRDEVAEAEENMVDVRRDDRTIKEFVIPAQPFTEEIVRLNSVKVIRNHEAFEVDVDLGFRRGAHVLIAGPNGIGKSTLLRTLAEGDAPGAVITPGVKVGYYRQDFSGLQFDKTPYEALKKAQIQGGEKEIYSAAAHFLLNAELLHHPIGSLSEGQKGLLCYARFLLQQPGLLILDEPTNHINFRHLPIIAESLNNFEGAIIVVSHDQEFVSQLEIDQTLDLESLR